MTDIYEAPKGFYDACVKLSNYLSENECGELVSSKSFYLCEYLANYCVRKYNKRSIDRNNLDDIKSSMTLYFLKSLPRVLETGNNNPKIMYNYFMMKGKFNFIREAGKLYNTGVKNINYSNDDEEFERILNDLYTGDNKEVSKGNTFSSHKVPSPSDVFNKNHNLRSSASNIESFFRVNPDLCYKFKPCMWISLYAMEYPKLLNNIKNKSIERTFDLAINELSSLNV